MGWLRCGSVVREGARRDLGCSKRDDVGKGQVLYWEEMEGAQARWEKGAS